MDTVLDRDDAQRDGPVGIAGGNGVAESGGQVAAVNAEYAAFLASKALRAELSELKGKRDAVATSVTISTFCVMRMMPSKDRRAQIRAALTWLGKGR